MATIRTDAPEKSTTRKRRVRALLASGLVLGVGASITLAAWNDSEFVTGVFTSGSFNVQGSTTNATTGFTDHTSAAGAAALTFDGRFNNLSPEDVTYASYWVRLAANTTVNADLEVDTIASSGAAASELSWRIARLASNTATCDAAGMTAGTPLASGTALTTANLSGPSTALLGGTPATNAGEAILLCIEVTAGDDLPQNSSATATWQFTATSN